MFIKCWQNCCLFTFFVCCNIWKRVISIVLHSSVSLEYCVPQSSSSSSAGSGGTGLYLDAYEVSFPLEENAERPPVYHLNQGQQMIDGTPSVLHLNHCSDNCSLKAFFLLFTPHFSCFPLPTLYPLPAEPVVQEPPHPQYSPFILVSNLRAHLYVALEKNAWLQKRIEELEEERNFLRCQLDRFIVSMRGPEGEQLHCRWCICKVSN